MISLRSGILVGAMVVAVGVVGLLASWDADREAARGLADFADQQATLARTLGALAQEAGARGPAAVRAALEAAPRPPETVILSRPAGALRFTGGGGRELDAPPVAAAFGRGETVALLSRPEAAGLGLPTRTAWAGLARADGGPGGTWEIAVVTSAQRQRDRERAASRRLLGSVASAAVLVLAFGGFAMRQQRKELVLERELAVAALQQSGDDRLQRASRMAALGTLAIGVAHEISTPLGVIAGRAEQLMPRAEDDRARRGLGAILDQVKRINEVVRGLLGLARGDVPAGDRVTPAAVVEAAVGLVEHRFLKAGVPLASDVGPDLPRVSGDARLIEHAIVNLLLNACDACRAGGAVTVSAAARQAAGRREVVFTVVDTGEGISATDLNRVVEPFFTTKPSGEGTGLGLAIAREIAGSHRGGLTLAPGAGRGTVVTLWLPAAADGPQPERPPEGTTLA